MSLQVDTKAPRGLSIIPTTVLKDSRYLPSRFMPRNAVTGATPSWRWSDEQTHAGRCRAARSSPTERHPTSSRLSEHRIPARSGKQSPGRGVWGQVLLEEHLVDLPRDR